MATAEQVQEWRALRGRFLNALWDAENGGQRLVPVSDLLDSICACDLPDHQIDRLVRDLNNDGLISELGFGSAKTSEIRLTSEGRYDGANG